MHQRNGLALFNEEERWSINAIRNFAKSSATRSRIETK